MKDYDSVKTHCIEFSGELSNRNGVNHDFPSSRHLELNASDQYPPSSSTRRRQKCLSALSIFLGTTIIILLSVTLRIIKSPVSYTPIIPDEDYPDLTNRQAKAQSLATLSLATLSQSHISSHHISVPHNCESTILILRHCEKSYSKEHCNTIGYQRAQYLATLFGSNRERWPTPSYLYALKPKRHKKHVYREIETIQPLSEKIDIDINSEYGAGDNSKLANYIFDQLNQNHLCGKLSVISWKHEEIPDLAQQFGCGPLEGCPLDYPSMSFDDAWIVQYRYEKKKHGKMEWRVFGSVQKEGFDPLRFGKEKGVYDSGGVTTGEEQ